MVKPVARRSKKHVVVREDRWQELYPRHAHTSEQLPDRGPAEEKQVLLGFQLAQKRVAVRGHLIQSPALNISRRLNEEHTVVFE
jgi:hypothetical protein